MRESRTRYRNTARAVESQWGEQVIPEKIWMDQIHQIQAVVAQVALHFRNALSVGTA